MPDIPRQQLAYILTQFGRSICDDPKHCEALLKDLCPNHKREVNLLLAALREGVVTELLNTSPLVPIESTISRLTLKMHDNLGIAENLAQWAVESWGLVLGIQFNSSKIAPSSDKEKVGMGLPIKPINQPSQAIIEQFKGWQKIGINGEKLAIDAPQWAAVIDEKTKLMWAANPNKNTDFPNPRGYMTWDETNNWLKHVNKKGWLNTSNNRGWCGYYDWRLPTVDELKNLLNSNQPFNSMIKDTLLRNVRSDCEKGVWFWSSSLLVGCEHIVGYKNHKHMWIVHLYDGSSDHTSCIYSSRHLQLVRTVR